MAKEIQAEWAREVKRKKIPNPYTISETLSWAKNNVLGPSKKYSELTPFIKPKIQLNEISPKIKLGFIGDIMQMNERELIIGENLKQFFTGVDFLIGNFEGTITSAKKGFMSQKHSEKILKSLTSLNPPEKTVLTNANNHSGDFGWNEYNKSYELLKEHGFLTIGRRDEVSIHLKEKVNLVSVTKWSNQNCLYVGTFKDIDEALDPNVPFNILFPHWGYEEQLYPNPDQIKLGKDLLEKWNMIVGHHSHCPQPIASYEIKNGRRVLAYSLGDFCTFLKMNKYRFGLVIKAEIGPNSEDSWHVGNIEWSFSSIEHPDEDTRVVDLVDSCKYFE